jgi:hypothetical protein
MMLHPERQSISPLSEGTTLIKKAQGLFFSGIVCHLEELPEFPLNILTVNSGELQ